MAGANAGRRGGRWRSLARAQRAKGQPCWLCGQAIDYALPATDQMSFSVDHFHTRDTRPDLAEDPANLRSAHLLCNKQRGNRDPSPDLGLVSQQW